MGWWWRLSEESRNAAGPPLGAWRSVQAEIAAPLVGGLQRYGTGPSVTGTLTLPITFASAPYQMLRVGR